MGWLDQIVLNTAIDRASLTDGRARFRTILHAVNGSHGRALPDYRAIDAILHDLGGEGETPNHAATKLGPIPAHVRVVVVPGFLAECIAFISTVLTDALAHLESLGAKTLTAQLDGRGGAAGNARQLRDAIMDLPKGETVIVIALSKGAVDTQEMLALYPETQARIAAFVSLAGAVGGSPLAHQVPGWIKWIEAHLPMPQCRAKGGAAGRSLTPEVRRAFLQNQTPVPAMRYYSVGAVVDAAQVSKSMASAHLTLETFGSNDGQMLLADQVLPSSEILGVLNADHIAVGVPFNRNQSFLGRCVIKYFLDQNAFPREVVVEAIVRRVLEDL